MPGFAFGFVPEELAFVFGSAQVPEDASGFGQVGLATVSGFAQVDPSNVVHLLEEPSRW